MALHVLDAMDGCPMRDRLGEGVSQHVVPNEVMPGDVVADHLGPNEVMAGDVVPNEMMPRDIVPKMMPRDRVPKMMPRDIVPDQVMAGDMVPDQVMPDEVMPDDSLVDHGGLVDHRGFVDHRGLDSRVRGVGRIARHRRGGEEARAQQRDGKCAEHEGILSASSGAGEIRPDDRFDRLPTGLRHSCMPALN
jgi:hypothetical protein